MCGLGQRKGRSWINELRKVNSLVSSRSFEKTGLINELFFRRGASDSSHVALSSLESQFHGAGAQPDSLVVPRKPELGEMLRQCFLWGRNREGHSP